MIHRRSDLHFFMITKRPERILQCLPEDWGDGYENVTICCTMENQRRVDERLPIYMSLPLKHKSIICEPCLAPNLTFDKVDVFSISSGRYIVYLTAEHPSNEFMALVKDVRDAARMTGCNFDNNFRLHVTLGRVYDENIGIEQLRNVTNSITVPSFTFRLPEVRYMEYRFKERASWTLLSTT